MVVQLMHSLKSHLIGQVYITYIIFIYTVIISRLSLKEILDKSTFSYIINRVSNKNLYFFMQIYWMIPRGVEFSISFKKKRMCHVKGLDIVIWIGKMRKKTWNWIYEKFSCVKIFIDSCSNKFFKNSVMYGNFFVL